MTPACDSPVIHNLRFQQDPTLGQDHHDRACLTRQEEFCLVHHYITSVCTEFAQHEDDHNVWKHMPFLDGLKYEFVLDVVLALAALHKAHLEPANSKKYTSACVFYQSRSLSQYKLQLSSIDAENCNAVFAVSTLINVLSIAMSRGGPDLLATPPLETLLSSFRLLKGSKVVLHDTWSTINSAHYRSIVVLPELPPYLKVSAQVSYAMESLRRCAVNVVQTPDSSNLDTYWKAIDMLEDHFRQVEHNNDFRPIIAWLIKGGDEPIKLLERYDPMMLLIFVHYGVLYLNVHDRWWAHDFGRRIVLDFSEALHMLDIAWRPLTSWARAQAAKSQGIS
jgi:hypothetical protein